MAPISQPHNRGSKIMKNAKKAAAKSAKTGTTAKGFSNEAISGEFVLKMSEMTRLRCFVGYNLKDGKRLHEDPKVITWKEVKKTDKTYTFAGLASPPITLNDKAMEDFRKNSK